MKLSSEAESLALPMPPAELRRSVGHEGTEHFENPHGVLVFGEDVPEENYRSVLDFGCGCGRIARQMMLQRTAIPERYLGLDLYRPSVEWCQRYLRRSGFTFQHLNVRNVGLNPNGKQYVDFQVDEQFSLINAHSVFTHIIEPDLAFYFAQCVRRLDSGGVFRSTWFMFDKQHYPMMQTFQNCLYINPDDLTNAAIYDVGFVRDLFARHGLTIFKAKPPGIRGHQWLIYAERGDGRHVDFADDNAPLGLARPPVTL